MTICNYVSFGVSCAVVLCYIVYFIYTAIKKKSIAKALKDTAQFAEDLYATANSEKVLKLREKCKDFIYKAEDLFSTYAGKAGVFKLDSVLKNVQIACMQEDVAYNEEYWTNYVNEEVANMKGVK